MQYDAEMIRRGFDLLSVAQIDTRLERMGAYYIGPCPFCGGTDRFNMKLTTGGYMWICRRCAPGKYYDAIDYIMRREHVRFVEALQRMKDDQLMVTNEALARERMIAAEAEQAARQAEIDARLSDLTTHEIWEALHRRLTDEHRAWWREQGIPDEWQDYLSLGYTPDKTYESKKVLQHSPAYTIPYFHHDASVESRRKFVTMQYRLIGACDPCDRYRFEYGIGSSYYMTTPTLPVGDTALICEGAKKAIVTRVYGQLKDTTVIGVPSKSDSGNVVEIVKHCERVWVMLDPDAFSCAYQLARDIGKKARVVTLPLKVDDAILRGILTNRQLSYFLKNGVQVS